MFVIAFTVLNIAGACGSCGGPRDGDAVRSKLTRPGTCGTAISRKYNNPLPRWWLGLFILTIVFGAAYLLFYPGLGNFTGVGKWIAVGATKRRWHSSAARSSNSTSPRRHGMSLQELAANARRDVDGANLFGANCSTCHGSDARGARGFPNLTDDDWLWGGEQDAVYETIANGRHGVMPALGTGSAIQA